jgi:hypothetical protein
VKFFDPKKLHVPVNHAAHLLAEHQQLPTGRGGVGPTGDQVGITDVIPHVVRDTQIDEMHSFGPGGQQGLVGGHLKWPAGVQVHVGVAGIPTLR